MDDPVGYGSSSDALIMYLRLLPDLGLVKQTEDGLPKSAEAGLETYPEDCCESTLNTGSERRPDCGLDHAGIGIYMSLGLRLCRGEEL